MLYRRLAPVVFVTALVAAGFILCEQAPARVQEKPGRMQGRQPASTAPLHETLPAASADDFVDRIGVCTHLGYPDTPYGFAYDRVKTLLGEAGIRHIRDGLHPRVADLNTTYGIRVTAIFGPGDAQAAAQTVKQNLPLIDMVEGPNEVDLFAQSATYQGKRFPDGPRLWMRDLYAALKADRQTAAVPVIAPSVGRAGSVFALAPLTQFDYGVMHSYAGGQMPTASLTGDVNNNLVLAQAVLGPGQTQKRLVVTESGYHTALGSSVVLAGAQSGVSEKAQAKYLLRHFAEYFNAGIVRTFTYEFADEFPDYNKDEREATNAEACFGLVKRDLTPKPAYTALKNLIGLLSEARWDGASKTWRRPAPAAPTALSLTLTGATPDIHQTLLQKANGDYYLLLWREVSSFDTKAQIDVVNPAVPVTVTLPRPVVSAAAYRPGEGVQPAPLKPNGRVVALPVDDSVTVLRLKLAPVSSKETLRAPLSIRTESTGDTTTLHFADELRHMETSGPMSPQFLVYRNGAFMGATSDTSFVDTIRQPDTGYVYEVAVCNRVGRISPRTVVTARTPNVMPDLVVEKVGWQGDSAIKAGADVRFTATIKNIGTFQTPKGVAHGVAFFVDGQFVSFSTVYFGPLAPGASVETPASGGPKGSAVWKATPGKHTLRAVADDVNRITESDKTNNTRDLPFTVAP